MGASSMLLHRHRARAWYVDSAAAGTNAGTSWTNAWTSFASISWASMAAGDTLFISGGTTSVTYSALLTIAASGTSGRPIVITAGIDPGHNGTVIIDGGNARECINTNSQNWITVQNLTLQNTNDTCIFVNTGTGLVIQNLTIHTGGPSLAGNARGIDVRHCLSGNVIVRNNTVTTASNVTDQTDCIFATDCDGIVIDGNSFFQSNSNSTGHNDLCQIYDCGNVTISNNYMEDLLGFLNNHGIWTEAVRAGKTYTIFNNVLYRPGTAEEVAISLYNDIGTGNILVYNNTIYGGPIGVQLGDGTNPSSAACEIKDNIIYPQRGGLGVYFRTGSTALTAASQINRNLVFADNDGNLSAVCGLFASTIGGVRSTTSFSSGLKYFEVTIGSTWAGGNSGIGLMNASKTMSTFIGAELNSFGYFSSGNGYINGTAIGYQAYSPGQVIAVACDFGNSKIWVKNLTAGGGWLNGVIGSQNPVGNVGGRSISTITGPYFAAMGLSGSLDSAKFNFGASAFVGTIPTGYSAWGSAATLNPSDILVPATITCIPGQTVANGMRSFAQWQSDGFDVNGLNVDPLFVAAASKNLTLQSGSPARDAGATLTVVAQDKNGYARPRGAAPDIGAYEF